MNVFDLIRNWLQPSPQLNSSLSQEQQETISSKISNSSQKIVVYDCETIQCIPTDVCSPHIKYCKGWDDFKGMGISVIGAYSSWDDRYHIYLEDNLKDFQKLIDRAEEIVGFNSLSFDDKLCTANGLKVKTTYDLLCQVRLAAGMPSQYVKGVTRSGYSLGQLAKANLGYEKSGTGELAPEFWQKGERGKVINYCLADVVITRKLYERREQLIDPTNGNFLRLSN